MATGRDLVYEAETARASGRPREAVEKAMAIGKIDPQAISSLSKDQLIDKMRAWRIWVDALLQLYKREWNGNQAGVLLWRARKVIDTYYNLPEVKIAAKGMKTDPEGDEYQMLAEMWRDRGKRLLCAAEINGGCPILLNQAIDCFNQAIGAAEENTSVQGLALMETEMAKRRLGRSKFSWDNFSSGYETIVAVTLKNKNWDRLATASWWYTTEALLTGRGKDFQTGLTNLQVSCRNLKTNWLKYPLKEIVAVPLSISRRLTYNEE